MNVYILTVEVTAQKFKPQSRLVNVGGWMDANVTANDWGGEDVLIDPGAIQVSIKFLLKKKKKHEHQLLLQYITNSCMYP